MRRGLNLYCRECGEEIKDDDLFCRQCGTAVKASTFQYSIPRKSSWDAGRIAIAIIGGFLILISIPLLFGGTVVTGITEEMDTGSGYIGLKGINLETSTQSLIFKELRIEEYVVENMDNPFIESWSIDPENFVNVRFYAESNNGKEIFVGIIGENDALGYLGGAEYDYVTDVNMIRFDDPTPNIVYRNHPGESIIVSPEVLSSWVEFEKGESIEYLQWDPTFGDYWLVLMNSDLSPGVDVDVGVGVRIPFISAIGRGLIAGGLICLISGAVILYFGGYSPEKMTSIRQMFYLNIIIILTGF